MADGATADEARDAARRAFGNVTPQAMVENLAPMEQLVSNSRIKRANRLKTRMAANRFD
jgi:hypothetical protein